MTGRWQWVASGALLLVACACTGGNDGAPDEAVPATAGEVGDLGGLVLDGPVDAVVRMQPGAPGEPLIELWILQVRMDAQAGGGLQECRAIIEAEDSMSSTCDRVGQAPGGAADGPPPLVRLSSFGPRSVIVALSGQHDTTHFVVTAGQHRIAVIPIDGEPVLRLAGGCPADATVAAWRGDEMIQEEPGLMC